MAARAVCLSLVLLGFISAAVGQEVSLSTSTPTIDEGDSAELCLDVTNGNMISGTATVTLRTVTDNQNTRADEDYVSLSEERTFTPTDEERQCVTVQTLQDDVVEDIEAFTVTLENPVGITVGTGRITVAINQDDSDVIMVDFSSTTFTGTEGDGVNVCVTVLSGSVGRALGVMVGLRATDETTTGAEDYGNVASLPITVPDGTMPEGIACTSIGLTNDLIVEPDESFTLNLVALQFQSATVTDTTASITIMDNDMAAVNVSSSRSVVEGNSGTNDFSIQVELVTGSVPLARDVVVTLSTEDGTAIAGSDYETVSLGLTFVAGSANGATMSVTVPIIGDDIGEADETFIILITPSTPDMATSANITITNDDMLCPNLGAPDSGSVDVPSLIPGSNATYSCNEGYNLAGDATRMCDSTSTWTGSEPTCQIVDCGSPPGLRNGSASAPETTFGGVATYTCNEGYQFTSGSDSPRQRECLISGMWSDADLECEEEDEEEEEEDDEGLSGGEIAGIIIAVIFIIVVLVILVVVFLIFLWTRKQDRRGKFKPSYDTQEKTHTIDKADIGEPIPQTDDAENGIQQSNESLVN